MSRPVRLAFVWHALFHIRDLIINWEDGLRAALDLLGRDWSIRVFIPNGEADLRLNNLRISMFPGTVTCLEACREWQPDLVLCWGSLDRPIHSRVREIGVPTALCFAGGAPNHANIDQFDVLFYETPYHEDFFNGRRAVRAFGINTELFRPTKWQRPHFLGVLPAAFAAYKRYRLFAEAMGERGLAVGQVQVQADGSVWEGEICHEVCLDHGVTVLPRLTPYYLMPYIFGLAEVAVLTATTYGGCDRTVLEAMACGKPVVVCDDNQKLRSILPPGWPTTRPEPEAIRAAAEAMAARDCSDLPAYVQSNFSHRRYAAQLKEGLEGLL